MTTAAERHLAATCHPQLCAWCFEAADAQHGDDCGCHDCAFHRYDNGEDMQEQADWDAWRERS